MSWDLRYASSQMPAEETTFTASVAVGNVVFVSGCTCGRVGEARAAAGGRSGRSRARERAARARGDWQPDGQRRQDVRPAHQARRLRERAQGGDRVLRAVCPAARDDTAGGDAHGRPVARAPGVSRPVRSDRCARPRHARLGSDLSPRVLGREGARLPARAEGAREVRAEPVDREPARRLGLPGARPRDGEGRNQRLRGAIPHRARQDQGRARGDRRVARQSREDERVHQGCERADDVSRRGERRSSASTRPSWPPIRRRARCS